MLKEKRLESLDVLRGIAILLVIGRHLPMWPDDPSLNGLTRSVLLEWRRVGWIGVDLFFVLSGFLISGLVFREYQRRREFRPLHFLIRRGFKIYPAFYFCVALTYAWIYFTAGGHVIPLRGILGELFFLQNYVGGFLFVTWSLAIEEHFYLLLALLLFWMSRSRGDNPFQRIPVLFAFVALGVLAVRIFTFDAAAYMPEIHLLPTHKRADALFYGVLLSYLHHYHGAALKSWYRQHRALLLALSAANLSYVFFNEMDGDRFIHTLGFSCHSIAFSFLLLFGLYDMSAARAPRPLALLLRAIAFVGVHSYSIYLWHEIFMRTIWTRSLLVALAQFGGAVAAFYLSVPVLVLGAILWGVLIAWIVEIPFLKLRDRLYPSRSIAAEPAKPAPDTALNTVQTP